MVSLAMGAAMMGTMYFLWARCAQHGGSASGGGLVCVSLRSYRALLQTRSLSILVKFQFTTPPEKNGRCSSYLKNMYSESRTVYPQFIKRAYFLCFMIRRHDLFINTANGFSFSKRILSLVFYIHFRESRQQCPRNQTTSTVTYSTKPSQILRTESS